jgi:Putative MetA-pathway of phenol degradation
VRFFLRLLLIVATIQPCSRLICAQDLAPRAYVITPVRLNAVNLTYSFFDGSIILGNAVPIAGATGRVNVQILSYYRSLNFFGRSSSVVVALPYGVGNFDGTAAGVEAHLYRSGLLDSTFRFSVNLKGGPAMGVPEFSKWRQKTLIGVSFKFTAPTSQYDPTKLVNFGTNRWSFEPEVGLSKRRGHWLIDTYGGVWFFTDNPEFFSHNQINLGVIVQAKNPVGAFEGHLSYDVRPRLWASLDGNFWFGGSTSNNSVPSPSTSERNSRIGATVSLPMTKRQSIKFSYSDGAYIRYGGNFQNVSVGWQYSWVDKSK